ncbi:MAG TPA: RNA-binding protein [Methyloceanibacter sp.]|nr:RNA-binding protein [Methyloceanibacter sp.]
MRPAAAEHERRRRDETVRACALTRARRPKDELIRFVLGPGGVVVADLKERLPGRGVWLTAAKDVVAEAAKRNVFARALKTEAKAPENLAEEVEQRLLQAAVSALSLANKAGEVVFGNAKVEEAVAKERVLALIHAKEAAEDGCRKLDGKARGMKGGRPIPAIRSFNADELSLASGRTNVIHAALIQGGAARNVLAAASRLERYRRGRSAFATQNGSDTNKNE